MDAELDALLADDRFADLSDRSVGELRALRAQCQGVETQLSYLRRLVQGRHDIVTGEIERQRGGGDPDDVSDLVDRLPEILSDRIHAPGPGHLPSGFEPGELSGRLADRLEQISEAVPVDGSADGIGLEQLVSAAGELGDLEQEVSTLRRAMFDRIDAVQAELTRRYRDGEAQVDELLTGDD